MKSTPERSPLFLRIQPACVCLIKEPTYKNVQRLQEALAEADVSTLEGLQEYILFPVYTVIRAQDQDERLTIAALELATSVLERTGADSALLALDLFQRVFLLLGAGAGDPAPPATSEELRMAVLRCGTALVLSCRLPALEALYSERGRLALGHAVFHLAAAVRGERSRQLQLAAVDCLLACAGTERPEQQLPAALRRRSSRLFVALLPGVLSALHAVFAGDLKLGHRVIARALHAWTALVCHVLSDAAVRDAAACEPSASPTDPRLPSVERSEAWLGTVSARLLPMVSALSPLTRHYQPGVRRALVALGGRVLTQCADTLADCASPLLQLLILVSCDELADVRAAADTALRAVQERALSKTLVEVVEEDLYALVTRLPTVVRSCDTTAGLVQLSLLEGYLHLLGSRVRQLTGSSAHVRRLISCLTQLVELRSDAAVVAYVTPHGQIGGPTRFPEFLRFKHFDDAEVWRRICSACRLLGCHGDLITLLDLLDAGDSDEDRVIWNQLLLGQEPALLTARGVQQLPELEQLIDPEPLLLLIEPERSAVRRCLGLQGLAHLARVTPGRQWALHLLALCPVLEAAGGADGLVPEAARATVAAMAGERGVPALIRANVGRLAVHVRTRLACRRGRQVAPLLVAAVLQLSEPELADALPYLEDMVRPVMRALDEDYERCGAACLSVLRRTVDAVARWYPPEPAPATDPPPPPAAQRLLAHHRRQVTLRHELALAAAEEPPEEVEAEFRRHWNASEDAPTDPAPEARCDADAEQKLAVPPHLQLVRDVVLQAVHFLDCDQIAVQVDVLSTLCAGSWLLAAWPDELLPLVARCWQPLVRCCRARQPLLLRHALTALHAVVCCAGDFLRHRVTAGPLRPLLDWLRTQADASATRGSTANLAHSQTYKLQAACLRLLGETAARLRLDVLQLEELVLAVLPYLSCRQPDELQTAAGRLLLTTAQYDPDTVWLCLRRLLDDAAADTALQPLYDNARGVFDVVDAVGGEQAPVPASAAVPDSSSS